MTGKKQYKEIECKDCHKRYQKRVDSLPNWCGRCNSCTLVHTNSLPSMKEQRRKNGLKFIEKFGKLAPPKMENRRRGETHYNWRGGVTPFRIKIWHSNEYKHWRKSVFERDGYKCVLCKKNTHALEADHIKPFAVFVNERFLVENGRTMCIPCHRQYGARVRNGIVTREAAWVSA